MTNRAASLISVSTLVLLYVFAGLGPMICWVKRQWRRLVKRYRSSAGVTP